MVRVLLLIVGLGCLAGASETRGPLVERVVVVVIDGPRWSETWGEATRVHIPRRALQLAPQGVLFTAFLNRGPTYTNSGHAAIANQRLIRPLLGHGALAHLLLVTPAGMIAEQRILPIDQQGKFLHQ